jgi:HEPN domain-containing protein
VMESLQIPKRLMQTLRRRAEELGVTPEEFLIELMVDAVDPGERSQAYIDAAREMLEQAKKELGSGDLRQASEKIWGAAALAVKAHAYARERRRLASHAELWQHKSRIAEELGDWVDDAWNAANAMHVNFYEGWADARSVERALGWVVRFVEAVQRAIGEQAQHRSA